VTEYSDELKLATVADKDVDFARADWAVEEVASSDMLTLSMRVAN